MHPSKPKISRPPWKCMVQTWRNVLWLYYVLKGAIWWWFENVLGGRNMFYLWMQKFCLENNVRDHVMPLAPFITDTIIFMQDNGSPHIAGSYCFGLLKLNQHPDLGVASVQPSLNSNRAPLRCSNNISQPKELERVVLFECENISQASNLKLNNKLTPKSSQRY